MDTPLFQIPLNSIREHLEQESHQGLTAAWAMPCQGRLWRAVLSKVPNGLVIVLWLSNEVQSARGTLLCFLVASKPMPGEGTSAWSAHPQPLAPGPMPVCPELPAHGRERWGRRGQCLTCWRSFVRCPEPNKYFLNPPDTAPAAKIIVPRVVKVYHH